MKVPEYDSPLIMANRETVVIVGGGAEIGSAIRMALTEDGFRVLTTYRSSPLDNSEDSEGRSTVYSLDVRNHERVTEFFRHVEVTFGAPFGLVYVAGCTREAPIALLQDEAWDEVLAVNLSGAFACIRAAARPMMVKGRGRIVMVGSVSARSGAPGQAAYAASKAGLEALARVAAVEFGRFNVCCNVVAPGAIDAGIFRHVADKFVTKILNRTTLRRLGTPTEVAAAVRFLMQPDAGYLTGAVIPVDGGLTAS
jgi:3-oxoacyl-[acyl-carrier protein] reductase